MAFQKGAKPGPGRPQGCKNKNYLNLNFWFELLHDDAQQLTVKERLQYITLAINTLAPKVQTLPATPGDSRTNADQALAELKAAEEYGINRIDGSTAPEPGSNGADVAAGPSQG